MFTSTATACEWVQGHFTRPGNSDEIRAQIHGFRRAKWAAIREDVRVWTLENWGRWEEEQPEWFDEGFFGKVDDEMIPVDALRRMNGHSGGRRRSSIGDVFGGGVEASVRERRRSSVKGGRKSLVRVAPVTVSDRATEERQ